MNHNLIMENWRNFVEVAEGGDPDLLEEGFLQNVALALAIGLGGAGAAQAAPVTGPGHAPQAVSAQQMDVLKQSVTGMFTKVMNNAEDPLTPIQKRNLQAGLDKIVKALDATMGEPGKQWVDDPVLHGFDPANPQSRASQTAKSDAEIVAAAWEIAREKLSQIDAAAAQKLEQAVEKELTPHQKKMKSASDWRGEYERKTARRSEEFRDALTRSQGKPPPPQR